MIVKGASLSYEDEKFAYLIAVREPWFVSATADRILARTEVSKAGFSAKVCRVDGTAERVRIGRREKAWFARVRKLDWGDELQPVSVDEEARYESSMEE